MGRNQGLNQTTPVGWDSVTGPSSLGLTARACVPARFKAGASGQFSHSPVAQCVQTKRCFVSCVGGGRGPSSDGLVQQRGDVLLLVAVRGTEHHHSILREAQRQQEQVGELSAARLRRLGSTAPPRQSLGRGLCGLGSSPSLSLLSQASQPARHVQHPRQGARAERGKGLVRNRRA